MTKTKRHVPWVEREHPVGFGMQKVYRFPNGYGASVVMFMIEVPYYKELADRIGKVGSYGVEADLWELGVIQFDGDEWELTYETPITSDVIGYLTDDAVEEVLDRIEKL